jgi:hypothetical protein
MSKFKVGDRVHTSGANRGVIVDCFSDTLWDVLHDNSPRRPISYQGWAYTEDELELIEDEPQPYDMPSPEADALDRIADAVRDVFEPNDGDGFIVKDYLSSRVLVDVLFILRETGRL